ncbi:hypothetical protein [Marinitoga lauensis]|uniref:hypothetical protein n=1 Tax=Marinitoga lauensis TaxID=2201189 RepID=UPI00197FDA5D|nr:hypothetical protein [Marinitoga lauensis]
MKNITDFFKEQKINFDTQRLYKNNNQKIAVMCYAENEENEILMLERIKEPFSGYLVPQEVKLKRMKI